jgi:anaerobic magnesium-protoporphyrin IX monomethyl ester cyclase
MSRNGQLDLVLVHPGTRMQVYQSLGSKLAAIEPPVWASLLATFVRKHGFSVQIVDAEAENLTPDETATRIEEMDPRLAVIVVYGHQPSASTQNMTVSGLICDALKELNPNRKLALVGGHVAALPERTLREEAADFVCTGEGPYTLVDLLEAANSTSPDYSKVRGICYWKDGVATSTPAAPLVKNLDDEIP